jgi:small subunit ribosomal protein S9
MATLKEAIIEAVEVVKEPKIDNLGRAYATGKRKNSIARVWIKKGTGKFDVNGKDLKAYFGREILSVIVNQPLVATKNENKFDVKTTIVGGGLSGQAGALLLGISKALADFDPTTHKTLRQGGFLTRDSRVVERKKYGLKKARKGQTYRKR